MSKQEKKKGFPWMDIIIPIVVLAFVSPELLAILISIATILAPVGILIFFILRNRKKQTSSSPKNTQFTPQTYSAPEPEPMKDFLADECPKRFCFHKDRGEHHLKQGKEIDPWDRPDIDISKYQHR